MPGLAALLTASAIGAAPARAETCDKYAAPNGSDSNSGTLSSPYRTANKLAGSLSAGQTGCLRGGDYTSGSGYIVDFARSGTSSAPITIRSYPGERARLVGIVMVRNTISNVRMSHLDFEGTGDSNTLKIYGSDVVVEDSEITNEMRGRSCMNLGSSSGGRALRAVIRRNYFHDCGATAYDNKDHSIYVAEANDSQIVDNVFSNVAGKTIQIYPDSHRNYVAHNVIDAGPDAVRGGIVIGGHSEAASTGNIVEKNVVTYAATYNVYSNWGSVVGDGNVVRDNCFWGAKYGDIGGDGGLIVSGNIHADPGFVDRANRDYRLRAGSPCLDVVEYDTAAKLAGDVSEPTPEPTPEPAPAGDTVAPTVSWTSPKQGATISGTLSENAGNCVVSAGDDIGIARVEFFLDGRLLNTEQHAPYSCALDTTTIADGSHTLKATAYDAAGNSTHASVDVTVANGPTNAAPWVELTRPLDGDRVGSTLKLRASAGDDHRVAKVVFLVEGTVVKTDTTSPYTKDYSLPSDLRSRSSITVAAKAYDEAGLTAVDSATVSPR